MEINRKPYQGVWNVLRFNWHYYVFVGIGFVGLLLVRPHIPQSMQFLVGYGLLAASIVLCSSLLASYCIYDRSPLYQLPWLPNTNNKRVLNINAGFDEISSLLLTKHPQSQLTICDFYDPELHTEISIKRARNAYPPQPDTIAVLPTDLPFPSSTFDYALAILSVHEIRNPHERIAAFKELHRVLKPTGQILVTEHLRDLSNFMAYTIGFFHFHSKSSWLHTFAQANLRVVHEIKTTPFITTFILAKNGDTL